MDILRKELNSIYEAQHLGRENLNPADVVSARARAEVMVGVNGACAVITDASCDRCYVMAGGFGRLMGFSDVPFLVQEVASSDEDEIYSRLHPEDLVDKRMLEYEFFRSVDALPPSEKTLFKATCRIRMRDREGVYRYVDNSTQVVGLSPAGGIWLILCCYDLSPDLSDRGDGISPCIVSNTTGETQCLSFGARRQHLLTEREKEILRLIREGRPSKQIAALLGISVNTVNRHRQNIISKLSVGNSIEAVTAATAMRLL